MPHCRLDRIASANSLNVRMENAQPAAGFDLMALARLIPRRMLRAGFEHPRLLSGRSSARLFWERFLAYMAGEAEPPPRAGARIVAGRRLRTHRLIVGGGPAARAAAKGAQGPVVLITRSVEPGGHAASAGTTLDPLPGHVTVLAGHEVYSLCSVE